MFFSETTMVHYLYELVRLQWSIVTRTLTSRHTGVVSSIYVRIHTFTSKVESGDTSLGGLGGQNGRLVGRARVEHSVTFSNQIIIISFPTLKHM